MASRALKIEPQRDVTTEPEVQTRHSSGVDEVLVALRAYELWQARGCPVGSDQEDWFNAEEELRSHVSQGPAAA
jgi:hypothetical protein